MGATTEARPLRFVEAQTAVGKCSRPTIGASLLVEMRMTAWRPTTGQDV